MKLLGTRLVPAFAVQGQTPDLRSAGGYPKMVQKQVSAIEPAMRSQT